MEQFYEVHWHVQVPANTAEEAATQALIIQRDKDSTATVFIVVDEFNREVTVDLSSRSHDL